MADVIDIKTRRPPSAEIVTRQRSLEWADVWGYLPDPDPILMKLGKDSEVFDKLLADPHLISLYQSRKAGVLNSEYKLVYPKGTEGLAEYFDTLVRTLPVYDIIAQLLDAPFYGFSVNEIIWREKKGKWVPAEIAQKPNSWFVWDKENRLRFLSKSNLFEGERLPDFKFLVARHFPSFKNPYGIRLLSRCFWPVAFKKGGWKYWMIFAERFGIPWVIGKVPPGTEDEKRNAMCTMFEKMVQSAVCVIDDDQSVELVNVGTKGQGSGSGVIFDAIINTANSEMSKAILTQTLSTEIGNKGAYAASQSHLAVRQELCQMDKRIVAGVFNQLFQWCCQFNFNVDVAPQFVFIEDEDAKEAHARRDTQLSNQGVRFKSEYYERTYNLRPGEFTVEEPKPNIPFGQQSEEDKQKDERLKERQDVKPKKKEDENA